MPIKLNSTGGGSVTLDVPSMTTANTLVLPAKSGNIITSADSGTISQAMLGAGVAGNGPLFAVVMASTQNVTGAAWTKVTLNSEVYDTANCFDATTNYRFTPNVAGYYQFNSWMAATSASGFSYSYTTLYKNGSVATGAYSNINNVGTWYCVGSDIVYMNGTTDYIELWAAVQGTTPSITSARFSGFLARAA